MDQLRLYYIFNFLSAFFFQIIITVNLIYQVETVGLNPLQLALVGTALELTVFVFEIPTGVYADTRGRRKSIIIGTFLVGIGFALEGSVPLFWAVVLGQVIWGIGYTFESGAVQAWLSDEIGVAKANQAFVRGTQYRNIAVLIGIPVSVGLAHISLTTPVVLGGLAYASISVLLLFYLREDHYQPKRVNSRMAIQTLLASLKEVRQMSIRKPLILSILLVGFFYGLYEEGYDRLTVKHLLDNISFPEFFGWQPVIWFGVIQILTTIVAFVLIELTKRKANASSMKQVVNTLTILTVLLAIPIAVIAWTGNFILAALCMVGVGSIRTVIDPMLDAWVNLNVDNAHLRASVFSAQSQFAAVGEAAGGPLAGSVGLRFGLRWAISLSAILVMPALYLLFRSRNRT